MGQEASASTSNLVCRRDICVEWHKHDRYGRVVGKVSLGWKEINLAQVEAGLAWHYVAYTREQSPRDRTSYAQAEARAREAHLGLWRGSAPVAPWEIRRAKREHSR